VLLNINNRYQMDYHQSILSTNIDLSLHYF
jgi:hypothetical protein